MEKFRIVEAGMVREVDGLLPRVGRVLRPSDSKLNESDLAHQCTTLIQVYQAVAVSKIRERICSLGNITPMTKCLCKGESLVSECTLEEVFLGNSDLIQAFCFTDTERKGEWD